MQQIVFREDARFLEIGKERNCFQQRDGGIHFGFSLVRQDGLQCTQEGDVFVVRAVLQLLHKRQQRSIVAAGEYVGKLPGGFGRRISCFLGRV